MAKKKKSARPRDDDADRVPPQKPVTFSPFKDLKKMLAERGLEAAPPAAPARPVIAKPIPKPLAPGPTPPVVDEDSILREAYAGASARFDNNGGHRMPVVPEVHHTIVSEEAEVLAALSDLVSGVGAFDLTETEEYIEGARVGLDPRLVSRLRRGEFAIQGHLDLARDDSTRCETGAARLHHQVGGQGDAHRACGAWPRPRVARRTPGLKACYGAMAVAWRDRRARPRLRDGQGPGRRRGRDVRPAPSRSPPRRPSTCCKAPNAAIERRTTYGKKDQGVGFNKESLSTRSHLYGLSDLDFVDRPSRNDSRSNVPPLSERLPANHWRTVGPYFIPLTIYTEYSIHECP